MAAAVTDKSEATRLLLTSIVEPLFQNLEKILTQFIVTQQKHGEQLNAHLAVIDARLTALSTRTTKAKTGASGTTAGGTRTGSTQNLMVWFKHQYVKDEKLRNLVDSKWVALHPEASVADITARAGHAWTGLTKAEGAAGPENRDAIKRYREAIEAAEPAAAPAAATGTTVPVGTTAPAVSGGISSKDDPF